MEKRLLGVERAEERDRKTLTLTFLTRDEREESVQSGPLHQLGLERFEALKLVLRLAASVCRIVHTVLY